MSRIIPEKIQDIEKGVDVPDDRGSPEKPVKKSQAMQDGTDGEETQDRTEIEESKNANGAGSVDENDGKDEVENNEKDKKKRVNFNEGANVSWERESILNPDDSTERHSNLLVSVVIYACCHPI